MLSKIFLFSIVSAVSIFASAAPAQVEWPSRASKVLCGGTVDGHELDVKVIPLTQIMSAESHDYRVSIYIDLSRLGRVRLLLSELTSDEDYAAREVVLAKLPPEEAALLRRLTQSHFWQSYNGFTDGFMDVRVTFGNKMVSLSCQEIKN